MKLWQKDYNTHTLVENFTVGKDRDMDMQLALFDIQGSLAHILMLSEVGLLDTEECEILCKELKKIYKTVEKGRFKIEDTIEDVHSQVEYQLTKVLGDKGKRIHSARSRNDQVLVDLKLYFRAEIKAITEGVVALFDVLQSQSERYKNVLMPGYTHLQIAMPSSFGLWFGAYAEALTDDMQLLQSVYKIVNQNPLGSAAGYGSSMPINRKRTTEILGFENLNYNVIQAQMGRGKTEHFVAFGMAALGHTLSKMAMDVCLFINQNFDFVSLPPELTTGSSIMPHKKNPDVFELLRAKFNRFQNLPAEITALTSNLPSGYHRDFQLLKEVLFPAIAELKNCLFVTQFMLSNLVVKEDILKDEKYKYIFSVEEVNRLVLRGVPFRDAYKEVGQKIENNQFETDKTVFHTHEGSIGNLCTIEVKTKMTEILRGFKFEKVDKKIRALVR